MRNNLKFIPAILFSIALLLIACTKDPHERFDTPPWLGGTNIETLEKTGKNDIFLALMDKAEYRTSIENQLFTLFVPSDSAFNAYFKSIGINSVEDLSKDQSEELFGQHILVNPRSRTQLLYEYAWQQLESPKGEYGTLFFKKQSYSVPIDYSEDVRYNQTYGGQTLQIHRGNTLIPLFTTEFFEDYFGDPEGSDYLFLYPNRSWSGTQWHDAMVVPTKATPDAEPSISTRTSSGFIYYIDRVVAPLPTIETYLYNHQDKYGLFYDLAQRFNNYQSLGINKRGERIYSKSYVGITDIANTEGPRPGNPANMIYMFSAFVPENNVLQDFLNNSVLKTYPTIDSVPKLFLEYLLQSHINTMLNLPSKMRKRFLNYYGEDINIDVDKDITEVVMTSNGPVYGLNRILEPNAFTCVPGPLFFNNNYSTFLIALNESGILSQLTQSDVNVTLFAPTNDELYKYGIRKNNAEGGDFIEIRKSDDTWIEIDPTNDVDFERFKELLEDYIYFGIRENFSSEEYLQMASDNYLHYVSGSLIAGGNQVAGDFCTVGQQLPSEKNGNLFFITNTIKTPSNAAEKILSDPELSLFAGLLDASGLLSSVQMPFEDPGVTKPSFNFMTESDQWTILAPTNLAIADAELAGLIPDIADQTALRNFINYHFVRGKSVFDDGNYSGTVSTQLVDQVVESDITYKTLSFTNSVDNLQVTDLSNQTIIIDHAKADILIEKGVIHKINSVLQY
jgi:uncharacterized surface protein with fasciclin (FAS1) repeats